MNARKNTGVAKYLNTYMPRVIAGALIGLGVAAAVVSVGCNTVKGAGEDLERGGEKLQGSAERHGAN